MSTFQDFRVTITPDVLWVLGSKQNAGAATSRRETQTQSTWMFARRKRSTSSGATLSSVIIVSIWAGSQTLCGLIIASLQMVHDIETAMDKDIDSVEWMGPATKAKAKEKLHLVANKIGYPDHWRDYSKLTIVRGDRLGNLIRAAIFENNRELDKIGKPVDRGEWVMSPPTVNAYYNPLMNDINFPAGILLVRQHTP
jgi:hypothetical protein